MRHGKKATRLSEQGLLRIPKNPKQRPALAKSKQVLERYNEQRSDTKSGKMVQLHPTKGERLQSVKRARAQAAMAAILGGQPGAANLKAMGDFIRNG